MIQRRYEINDQQREQIKDMFPLYQTGRPSKLSNRPKWAAWRDLPEERYAHGKRPSVASANGDIQDYLSQSSKPFTSNRIWKT